MALSKVAKARAETNRANPGITAEDGANPTVFHGTLSGNANTLQVRTADLEDSYQSYILGGNRFDLEKDATDGDTLRQRLMETKAQLAETRIAQSEQVKELQAEIKAGGDAFTELAKG